MLWRKDGRKLKSWNYGLLFSNRITFIIESFLHLESGVLRTLWIGFGILSPVTRIYYLLETLDMPVYSSLDPIKWIVYSGTLAAFLSTKSFPANAVQLYNPLAIKKPGCTYILISSKSPFLTTSGRFLTMKTNP